jgi:hypothetical protein
VRSVGVCVVLVLGSFTHFLLNIMMRRSPAFFEKKKSTIYLKFFVPSAMSGYIDHDYIEDN